MHYGVTILIALPSHSSARIESILQQTNHFKEWISSSGPPFHLTVHLDCFVEGRDTFIVEEIWEHFKFRKQLHTMYCRKLTESEHTTFRIPDCAIRETKLLSKLEQQFEDLEDLSARAV